MSTPCTPGFLSDQDIKSYIDDGKIIITPYDKNNRNKQMTPVGYNLTATDFIFSLNKKLLVNIEYNQGEKYCWIEPQDTVLILTREAIWVSKEIAGTFHSKVGVVSQGFGHISTTLDPGWQGPLLISINNPTSQKIKFTIAKIEEAKTETEKAVAAEDTPETEPKTKTIKYKSFVTLIFYRLVSPALLNHDNPSCRFDVLRTLVDTPPQKSILSRIIFWKKSEQHYAELKRVVGEIASINFVKLGVKETDGTINPEEFKQDYEEFAETINLYTASAHATTEQILSFQSAKKWTLRVINFLLLITPLSVIGYFAWDLGVKNEHPSTGTLMIPFFALLMVGINPFITSFLQKYFK